MTHAARTTDTAAPATLQRACDHGGSCASCRDEDRAIQPKLTIAPPGDAYEQEADRVADRIVSSPRPAAPAPIAITPLVQRHDQPMQRAKGEEADPLQGSAEKIRRMESRNKNETMQAKSETLQRMAADEGQKGAIPIGSQALQTRAGEDGSLQAKPRAIRPPTGHGTTHRMQRKASPAAPSRFSSAAATTRAGETVRTGGTPLSTAERSFFEPRFGQDLSQVRLHTDASAGQAAHAINARAFTLRNHIAFAPGQYSPQTTEGRRLIAHELTHTLQQGPKTPRRIDGSTALQRQPAVPVSRFGDSRDRIQRQCPPTKMKRGGAAGCGVCVGTAKFTGTFVHKLAQYAFFGTYPDMIPPGGSMEFSVPTVSAGETASFTPKVDLTLITEEVGMRVIYIGELKPFDDAGNQQRAALEKLDGYALELREGGLFDEVRLLDRDPPGAFPMIEPFYPPGCPRQKIHICRIQAGVYQYYCAPPWSRLIRDPRCQCTNTYEEEERRRKRRTDEDDQDLNDPIDVPVAPPETRTRGDRRPIEVPETPDVPVPVPVPVPGQPETRPEPRPDIRPQAPEEQPDGDVIEFPTPDSIPVEVPIAAMVATAGAFLYAFAKRNSGGPPQKYAQAAALAILVVVYPDRVQAASPGGGTDPLEAVFDAMTQDGVPVPEELRARIEADPALKAALQDAARSGNLTEAQRAINQQMMDAIAADPDAFSDEDLRMLATVSESTGATGAGPPPTAQTLRRMIDARRDGRPITDELPHPAGADGEHGESETAPPPAQAEPVRGVSDALRARLATTPQAERLFRAMIGNSGDGPAVNDDAVRRFLATVPGDLTAQEATQLIQRLGPSRGRTLDQIMSSLARAVRGIRAGDDASRDGQETGDATAPEAEVEPPSDLAEDPAAQTDPAPGAGPSQDHPGASDRQGAGGGDRTPEAERATRAALIQRVRDYIATGPALAIITPPSGFTYTDGASGTALVAFNIDETVVAGAIQFTVVGTPTPENTIQLTLYPTEMFNADGQSRGSYPARRITVLANLILEE